MSTEKSVAHPEAASMPSQVLPLFTCRPLDCLQVLEPAVTTVENIARWMSALTELEALPDARAVAESNRTTQRVIDAADEVSWDLDLVIAALRAAQKEGCA